MVVGRGCLTQVPERPSIRFTRPRLIYTPWASGDRPPRALTLLVGAMFIVWCLKRPFLRECRRGPRHFGESRACRTHLKKVLCRTRLFGGARDKYRYMISSIPIKYNSKYSNQIQFQSNTIPIKYNSKYSNQIQFQSNAIPSIPIKYNSNQIQFQSNTIPSIPIKYNSNQIQFQVFQSNTIPIKYNSNQIQFQVFQSNTIPIKYNSNQIQFSHSCMVSSISIRY